MRQAVGRRLPKQPEIPWPGTVAPTQMSPAAIAAVIDSCGLPAAEIEELRAAYLTPRLAPPPNELENER